MSKFSLDVLQRRVFPFVEAGDPDVILGAAFGEDVAMMRVGGDILVSHVDPIVGTIDDIDWLAVTVPPDRVEDVSHTLEELGTEFAFVGQVVQGTGVHVLQNGKTVHYTEIRCEEDDLVRTWALYPRDG